jgi:hypothetical protein
MYKFALILVLTEEISFERHSIDIIKLTRLIGEGVGHQQILPLFWSTAVIYDVPNFRLEFYPLSLNLSGPYFLREILFVCSLYNNAVN